MRTRAAGERNRPTRLMQFLVSYKITTGAYPGHRHGKTTPDPACGAGEARRWDLAAARAIREATRWDLEAARAVTDASLLADMLYWGNKRSLRVQSKFLPALLCVAEPHALVVGAVRDFLAKTEARATRTGRTAPCCSAWSPTSRSSPRRPRLTGRRGRPPVAAAAPRAPPARPAAPPFADGLLPRAHRGDGAAPPPKLPRRLYACPAPGLPVPRSPLPGRPRGAARGRHGQREQSSSRSGSG
ncbi:hypothetical protein ZWY2020_055750 [Hordeum vulgare]|nr:hypothetical protein ZWY2020_055750 [Hordeum vulgare]